MFSRHLKRLADNTLQDVLDIAYRARMDHQHVQMIRRKLQALISDIEQLREPGVILCCHL
jgi:hypothetical protein